MVRSIAFLAALATAGVAAAPAAAQAPAYRAVPVTAIATQNVVVGEVLWKCGPDGCTAAKATSRPAILCAQAVKKVGKLESFTVGGVAFGAEELAKCNAKAKDGGAALARN